MEPRAIVRFNDAWVSVLCPIGHLITSRALDTSFAGSHFEAEIGAHAAHQPNMFDRMAAACDGAGHPGRVRLKGQTQHE